MFVCFVVVVVVVVIVVVCVDIDECIRGTHNCHSDATCTNTEASFTCQCNDGYDGDGVTCSGKRFYARNASTQDLSTFMHEKSVLRMVEMEAVVNWSHRDFPLILIPFDSN